MVRAGHRNPLDASFSQQAKDNRWNGSAFPALYCCCSIRVARAVTRDLFKFAGVELAELRPPWRPKVAAVSWKGEVADVASAEGLKVARLPADYPLGVEKAKTRALAARWHKAGCEGVVARSASLSRLGLRTFEGGHAAWGELAIFVNNARRRPRMSAVRVPSNWLRPGPEPA